MSDEAVKIEKQGHVATLTLNRPDAMNAWNLAMVDETISACSEISEDENIRVVIITGAGRAFSAGADIGGFIDAIEGKVGFLDTPPGRQLISKSSVVNIPAEMWNLRKPVIAAINGAAVGVGLSVALACDMRMASENAKFSMAFVKRGLIPDGGSSFLLPRIVGPSMATRLALTGDVIDAKEALRIGLIDDVFPHGELLSRAYELAGRIAENPPIAVERVKKTIQRGIGETNLRSQIDYEIFLQNAMFGTADYIEGIKSFVEKREPKFIGQ